MQKEPFHRLPHFYFYPAKQIGKGTISYSAIPTLLDSSFPCPSIIFYMLYFVTDTPDSVSYTHLDVYKRQAYI